MRTPIDKNRATEEETNPIRGKTIDTAGKGEPELAEIVQSPDGGEPELSSLFSDETERELRTQWHEIQTGFVDEPGGR
jgi:hypothetical protein